MFEGQFVEFCISAVTGIIATI